MLKKFFKFLLNKLLFFRSSLHPEIHFHSDPYLRHTARRLEHLASLHLAVAGKRVLEVGAGIGDHSHYYLDRGCLVTITEARPENIRYLKKRYPDCKIIKLDMDHPIDLTNAPFEIIHCYGLLYHLKNPEIALNYLEKNCTEMLILETCVSTDKDVTIPFVTEKKGNPTQALSGTGCRPNRKWLYEKLKTIFEYVYLPITQPNHPEFPLDWNNFTPDRKTLNRCIMIATRYSLNNPQLTTHLIDLQTRHN